MLIIEYKFETADYRFFSKASTIPLVKLFDTYFFTYLKIQPYFFSKIF